jgi:hypothetical protein
LEQLPIELREEIYEYLVANNRPKMVPQVEHNGPTIPWSESNVGDQAGMSLNPFRDNHVFNTRIMGHDISYETRTYFLRTTPLYFRGSQSVEDLDKLLKLEVQPRKHLLDFIRHLRVYLRCEGFERETQNVQLNIGPSWLTDREKRTSAEIRILERYRSSLECLRHLPFEKHKIKLEICILHDLHEEEHEKIYEREKYNILEAIKSIYFFTKDAGANISVRYECINTGYGEDVTWELDLDADASGKVIMPHTTSLLPFQKTPNLTSLLQRINPTYALYNHAEPPSRRTWLDSISAAAPFHLLPTDHPNPSWKHALFGCFVANCTHAPTRYEPYMEVNNNSLSPNLVTTHKKPRK